ncbi:tumor necrosis factor [Brachyhypopomus gauderio]|uniref:tumor necrosis factor n=1 Tax=Brachyhypopomus gauderio TaxID=698409 RepID=UPI004041115F
MTRATDRFLVSETSVLPMSEPGGSDRSLRRELCWTRVVCITFTLMCTAVCALVFAQLLPGCKGTGHGNKENGSEAPHRDTQIGARCEDFGLDEAGSAEPHPAFLKIDCRSLSASAQYFLIWERMKFGSFNLSEKNDTLIFPSDGMYRISLQVTYRGTDQVPSAMKNILQHHLFVYSDSYQTERTILSAFETVYYDSSTWRKSLYSEGIFKFHKGDTLKVQTSDLRLIDCDGNPGTKTFLTVHLHGAAPVSCV